jgi:acyl-CoA synthetase (AMP-forming)/AMP-acid ligase II
VYDPLRNLSLGAILEEHVRSFPGKVALATGDIRLTFEDVRHRVNRMANALDAAGVKRGDRLLWLGQNSHRILEGIIVASRLGAMFCPANWRQTPVELAALIDDLEPSVIFWQEEEVGDSTRQARDLAVHRAQLWLQHDSEGKDSYEAFLAAGSHEDREREIDPDEGALIIFTAAFDGRPAGAVLSQTTILTQNLVLAPTQNVSAAIVFMAVGPMFHMGTLMNCLTVFHMGGTNVFVRRSDPETIATTIHRERCTRTWLVGKTMDEIAVLNANGQYDLKCLISTPHTPEWNAMVTVEEMINRVAGYGQTEVMGLATLPYYAPGAIGIFGRSSPLCQLRILDAEGNDVPPGETGEIVVRGPIVMNGYWNRPEINAERRRSGWHHTNDLGKREADGSLTFVGPKTQMIKSGVENIYPAEVEACIRRHPAVADVGIIGVPDDKWIQTVKAIISLKPDAKASPEDIIEHCRAQIASYKKPTSVEFIDRVPRGPTGSIDYRSLDEKFGGGNYPGGKTRTY